jgi:PAS domain S-box-containing protein
MDSCDVHGPAAESSASTVKQGAAAVDSDAAVQRFFFLHPDLLCISDMEGRFLRVNPAFLTLGYTETELTSCSYLEFVHPADRERTLAAMAELTAGRDLSDFENRYRCKNGDYRHLRWTASPDGSGIVYAAARDVTPTRRAEYGLRRANAQLARSNQELEDLAMVASHDLQEPLRKIRMFGDRLRAEFAGSLGSVGTDYVARMQNAAERGQLLITGLLSYARASGPGQRRVDVDCQLVAQQVVADLDAQITTVGGRVEIGDLPVLEGNPLQIRQLLQNLISNALKFHRPEVPPVVRLRAVQRFAEGVADVGARAREWWDLAVSDEGIGFDEQYAERIFRLFHQLHGRSAFGGSGVGLALCRRIVEHHGGTLVAASVPGVGTTFTASLPRHGEHRELRDEDQAD